MADHRFRLEDLATFLESRPDAALGNGTYGEAAADIRAALSHPVAEACWCEACRPMTIQDMRMILCPDCGNKRCPHATDHRNACTRSNEPGQKGSSYEHCPPAVAKPREVMTGAVPDDLPEFLEWVASQLLLRDTRAGNFTEGLSQSLRGRAHILRMVTTPRGTGEGA